MLTNLYRLALFTLLLSVIGVDLHAQYVPRTEFGDPAARRRSTLDTNNIRTTIYNYGFSGRTGAGQGIPYEWPKGTGRDYLALVAMFVGGEVTDDTGKIIRIVDVPSYRQDQATGASWNFEPVPAYQNPSSASIARSDSPATWPPLWIDKLHADSVDPGWQGSWNGFFGKNAFINGTEYYYHFSDDNYTRYAFHPHSADTSRHGLGIVVSQRMFEWKDTLVDDAILTLSDIHNVGTKDISKAAVTLWVADFVGGDGDSQDDLVVHNVPDGTVYFTDRDGFSSNQAFANTHVGAVGLTFIQTPGNLGLTNVQYIAAGAINYSTTPDLYYWNTFMTPGSFIDPSTIRYGDYDVFASCGLFPIAAGGSQRFVTALVFADDRSEIDRKIRYLRSFLAGGYSNRGALVKIISPLKHQLVPPTNEIRWNANDNDAKLKVDILFSSNLGDTWTPIAERLPNNGHYFWDARFLPDGVFNKIQIVAYDSTRLGYAIMDSSFIIHNGAATAPQIWADTYLRGKSFQSSLHIRWNGGDADGNFTIIDLFYKIAGSPDWNPIVSRILNTGDYLWDISGLPNSKAYSVKFRIRDDHDSSAVDSVGDFEVRNIRYGLDDSALVQRASIGTGRIEVHIVDSTLLTGHTYSVRFSTPPDSSTRYDVEDENTHATVVSGSTEVRGMAEGPLFDGIRLLVHNDSLFLDRSSSRWNRSGIYDYQFRLFRFQLLTGVPDLSDYRIELGNVGIDTSVSITINGHDYPARPVNFRISNLMNHQKVKFGFVELDGNDGRLSASRRQISNISDLIVFVKDGIADSLLMTWSLSLVPGTLGDNPQPGDVLLLQLFKPFQSGDEYRFQAIPGNILAVKGKTELPRSFGLDQNYPNPFNPRTNFGFRIANLGFVSLKIFDLLGREVATLVDEVKPPGSYTVSWDAGRMASGVYFYRLQSGGRTKTRKLLLAR